MSTHEQFADDLALLALGQLQGDERAALEKHLEGCAACRRELEQFAETWRCWLSPRLAPRLRSVRGSVC